VSRFVIPVLAGVGVIAVSGLLSLVFCLGRLAACHALTGSFAPCY
jgi:hypothetical protein